MLNSHIADNQISVKMSYAEIYNERVFDLLDESPETANAFATTSDAFFKTISLRRKALALKTHIDGSKYVAGLKEVAVQNADDARKVLQLGQMNRRVFGTLANQASSRSHAVFTIKVTTTQDKAQKVSLLLYQRCFLSTS
jgi:hypothetical protein